MAYACICHYFFVILQPFLLCVYAYAYKAWNNKGNMDVVAAADIGPFVGCRFYADGRRFSGESEAAGQDFDLDRC